MSTLEFDAAYSAITGDYVGGYVPTVNHDIYDLLIDGIPRNGSLQAARDVTGWDALTGHTSQYGYRGAIMHPSETASDELIREWVRDAGGDVFAIVPVYAGRDCEYAGWAVIYRTADA